MGFAPLRPLELLPDPAALELGKDGQQVGMLAQAAAVYGREGIDEPGHLPLHEGPQEDRAHLVTDAELGSGRQVDVRMVPGDPLDLEKALEFGVIPEFTDEDFAPQA